MSLSDKEDLEDGEIEDDDDDEEVIVVPEVPKPIEPERPVAPSKQPAVIEKRSESVDDDWATNVEKAIANALIKDGVEPPLPNISAKENSDEPPLLKSKRRRKPKSERNKSKTQKDIVENESVSGRVQIFNPKKQKSEEIDDEEYADEYEMLNVRGGSPPPMLPPIVLDDSVESVKGSSDDESYDSEEYKRMSYEERRQKRREQNRQNRRDREEREKEREERRRDRHQDRRDRDRNDRDDEHYERREPRKMEICKFYLLDCCAKRDKCSYLHAEFPCKYYYLGMKCPHKDCKFNHGKHLSEQFRGILLKHLETAPKEILGDFPRMGRDKALKLMDTTHLKLLAKERGDKEPSENETTFSNTPNIPSLLDGILPKPISNKNEKPRRTRWHEIAVPPAPKLPQVKPEEKESIPEHLSIQNMTEVLTQTQIDDLLKMGIKSVDQIKQLTLMQMDSLGLTISQISDMQLNVKKLDNSEKEIKSPEPERPISPPKDLDLRIPPTLSISGPATTTTTTTNVEIVNQDVDMRLLPTSVSSLVVGGLSNVPITSSAALQALDHAKDENLKMTENENKSVGFTGFYGSASNNLIPPVVDFSQYLKDAHMKDADGDSDDNQKDDLMIATDEPVSAQDEESELQIDESYFASDDEQEKSSLIATTKYLDNSRENTILSPVHTQESIIANLKELEEAKQKEESKKRSITEPIPQPASISAAYLQSMTSSKMFESFYEKPKGETKSKEMPRDPRKRRLSSNDIKSPSQSDSTEDDVPKRTSIYDRESDNDDEYEPKAKKTDKDMRLGPLMLDSDGISGDIDLRLPFKPIMASYIPATEIDASYASHAPINYKLVEVDVPKPNFRELRSSKHISLTDKISDPRLRRLLGMRTQRRDSKSSSDYDSSNHPPPIASPDPIQQKPPAPRLDPRRRKEELSISSTKISSPSSNTTPKKSNQLEMPGLMVMLQKSAWYQDLSSNNKIMVNQQLANLSGEIKKFNQDPSVDKVFDLTYVTSNPFLQHILTNLGVYMNENGHFCHVEDTPKEPLLPNLSQPPPGGLLMPPNVDLGLLNNLRPLLAQARPPMLPSVPRPSLLGMPPPLLPNAMFDENLINAIRGILPGPPNFPPPMMNDNFNNNRQQQNQGGRQQQQQQQNQRRDWRSNVRNDNRRR